MATTSSSPPRPARGKPAPDAPAQPAEKQRARKTATPTAATSKSAAKEAATKKTAARKASARPPAKSPPKAGGKAAPSPVQAYFRLRVRVNETIAMGPGKVALLEAIAATGSLTAAAQALGMSYRRAWLLLDELNRSLVTPAVETAQGGAHGGGSILTPLGMDLVERYRRVEDTAAQACAADLAAIKAMLQG